MSTGTTRRTRLNVETLEGRIALSTAAHAAHSKPPATVLANLTPTPQGSYSATVTDATIDPRIAVVTIRGTATSSSTPPVNSYSVTVTQAVDRIHSVTGSTTAVLASDGSGATGTFTARLTAGLTSPFGGAPGGPFGTLGGRFKPGQVTVVISPIGPFGAVGPGVPILPTVVVVRLQPARFS